jgi:hypothetical protein
VALDSSALQSVAQADSAGAATAKPPATIIIATALRGFFSDMKVSPCPLGPVSAALDPVVQCAPHFAPHLGAQRAAAAGAHPAA